MTLAFYRGNRYTCLMLVETVRRISTLLVTLALVFGPAVNSVYAASMGAKMAVAASSDVHSPSKCDDCGAAKAGMSVGMCSAASYCGGLTAFPSTGNAVFEPLPVGTLAPYNTRHMTGRADAPDPYPPKPTILS
jgi:hypothetical protein